MKKSIGGKFLGKGTYGCVFDPPLLCDGETKRREGVGKVFSVETHAAEDEYSSNKFKSIDKKSKYTIPVVSKCKVPIENTKYVQDEFHKCDKKGKLYYQLILKEKGTELEAQVKTNIVSVTFSDYLDGFINLAEGLVLFSKHQYCHRDIKLSNIIMTDKPHTLKYIDYGLSCAYKDVYDIEHSDFALKYDYPYFPPEFKHYYLHQTSKKGMSKTDLVRKVRANYIQYKSKFSDIGLDLKTMLTDYESELNNDLSKDIVKNTNKVDVFSLGMSLLMVCSTYKYDIETSQKQRLCDIIKRAIAFNYRLRFTPQQFVDALKTLKSVMVSNVKPINTKSKPIVPITEPTSEVAVTHEDCMKFYTVKQLKDVARGLKKKGEKVLISQNKPMLCKTIHKFLDKNDKKEVKRGRKPKNL